MPTRLREKCLLCLAVALAAVIVPIQGCGESQPPPVSTENFDAGKKDREEIIKKEYGQSAFDKGQANEKARGR